MNEKLKKKASEKFNLRQAFLDQNRANDFSYKVADLYIDLSKNLIDNELRSLLFDLAKQKDLQNKIKDQFSGKHINITENRSVLHTALRKTRDESLIVDGEDVVKLVWQELDKVCEFSDRDHTGITGKKIKTIVNIGIGGSDLGPVMAYEALKPYTKYENRFISNIDPANMHEVLKDLDPTTTLFIIVSKTFTTAETITNAKAVLDWFKAGLGDEIDSQNAIATHFVAVSTNIEEVVKYKISTDNIFGFWDWVGGRYSLTSAVGLSLAISIGSKNFLSLLSGFHSVDEYFLNTKIDENAIVLMGALNTYYVNYLGLKTHAVLPYSQYLHRFPAYLQQLTMESNGKTVDVDDNFINYDTGEVFFGEPGTNGQHAFYQLIHQGSIAVVCDFIAFAKSDCDKIVDGKSMHNLLLSNFLGQTRALAFGKTREEVIAENGESNVINAKVFPGNKPTTSIIAKELTPNILGQLIALYEQITFVQGVIWNINSFDQWGVQLGKVVANNLFALIDNDKHCNIDIDSSTKNLINFCKNNK